MITLVITRYETLLICNLFPKNFSPAIIKVSGKLLPLTGRICQGSVLIFQEYLAFGILTLRVSAKNLTLYPTVLLGTGGRLIFRPDLIVPLSYEFCSH